MINWICPFCNYSATLREGDYLLEEIKFELCNKRGPRITTVEFIVCPNPECMEFTLFVNLYDVYELKPKSKQIAEVDTKNGMLKKNLIRSWRLIPESEAKIFPDYIPKAILEDYKEACLIKDQSPKASFTLSRRCLQGMIRNFWEIKKNRLKDEIEALKDKVDPPTWEAIDSTRKIGNIGAHMEKDVNLIISVDPKEAELLINLIEILIADWYIKKHEKKKQLEEIKKISEQKESQKRK